MPNPNRAEHPRPTNLRTGGTGPHLQQRLPEDRPASVLTGVGAIRSGPQQLPGGDRSARLPAKDLRHLQCVRVAYRADSHEQITAEQSRYAPARGERVAAGPQLGRSQVQDVRSDFEAQAAYRQLVVAVAGKSDGVSEPRMTDVGTDALDGMTVGCDDSGDLPQVSAQLFGR